MSGAICNPAGGQVGRMEAVGTMRGGSNGEGGAMNIWGIIIVSWLMLNIGFMFGAIWGSRRTECEDCLKEQRMRRYNRRITPM